MESGNLWQTMIQQVFEKIYKIALPIPLPLQSINVFFVDVPPKTLIDTGIKTDESFRTLQEGLKEIGLTIGSIERILITHGHVDHYGQAKKLSLLSGAPIYIHSIEYGRVRSFIHSLGFLKSIMLRNGVPEETINKTMQFIDFSRAFADSLEEAFFLNDGDPVLFQSMIWKTIQCPGHSPGLICFHWPEEKILFTGDHLLKEITPNPVLNVQESSPPFRYQSLKEYLTSLEKIEKMDIALALPGHGEEIRDARSLIRKIYSHHEERMNLVLAALSHGEKTAFDISVELFPEVLPFEVFLGISEVLGHLEILKEKEKVRAIERNGRDVYSLNTG